MTIAELDRYVSSKKRVRDIEAREKATFDYIHASLVGRAVLMAMDNKVEFPTIHEVYPKLFNKEDLTKIQEEQQAQLSAARFIQFAESFNQKFNKEAANVE